MSKAKLYKVKLVQGFNAKGRRRAGVELQKGITQILELNEEQLAALEQDVWVEVSEAPEGSEATEPGQSAPEAGEGDQGGSDDDEEEDKGPYDGVSFKDLKAQATERGLDIKGIKSRDGVIEVLTAADAAGEGDDDDEEETEEVELSEDMTIEQLKQIAETQGVEDLDQYTDENKADLIKAIEEASTDESEES